MGLQSYMAYLTTVSLHLLTYSVYCTGMWIFIQCQILTLRQCNHLTLALSFSVSPQIFLFCTYIVLYILYMMTSVVTNQARGTRDRTLPTTTQTTQPQKQIQVGFHYCTYSYDSEHHNVQQPHNKSYLYEGYKITFLSILERCWCIL